MELKKVPIDSIKVPEVRVTARFDPELYEQFKASLKNTGQITPIIVYEVEGELVLCDGLHRLIESKENGDTEIYAAIMPGDMADVLTKNIFLDHLRGDTAVTEMISVIKYLDEELKLDSEKISAKTGLTRDYVEDIMKVSKLTPFCLEMLDQGKIKLGHAKALTRVTDPAAQEQYLGQVLMYGWTVKQLLEYIKEYEQVVQEPAPESPQPTERVTPKVTCFYCRVEQELSLIANPNTCTACSGIMLRSIAEADRQLREADQAKAE